MLFNLKKEYTDNILFAEDFICGDEGFDRKFSTAILTDYAIYVVYNTKKIIFEEHLKNIKNIKIHFIDNKFIIFFRLNNEKSRGFRVNKDYSKIATEIYDLMIPILKKTQTMLVSSLRNSEIVTRGIIGDNQKNEEDIDISSYGGTLTQYTYNSLKTLNSKL